MLRTPPSGPTSDVVEKLSLLGHEIGFGADGNNSGWLGTSLEVSIGPATRELSHESAMAAELAMSTRQTLFLFIFGTLLAGLKNRMKRRMGYAERF